MLYVGRYAMRITKILLNVMLHLANKDNKIDCKPESANIYKMFFIVSIIDILTQRQRQERVHLIFVFYFTVYIHYAYCQF